jgi:hypothetical protein
MSNPDQLDRELRDYLEKEPNLARNERLLFLRGIFSKHLDFNKLEHVITSNDFTNLINDSKVEYTKLTLPMRISKRQVDSSDTPHVAMVNSILSYLNKNSLLRRLVRFDDRD